MEYILSIPLLPRKSLNDHIKEFLGELKEMSFAFERFFLTRVSVERLIYLLNLSNHILEHFLVMIRGKLNFKFLFPQ